MKALLIAAFVLALRGCATTSAPPAAAVERPAPQRLAPDLCTDPPAAPVRPNGAGLVRPATVEEQAAMALMLNWVAATIDWGQALAERAGRTARSSGCTGGSP